MLVILTDLGKFQVLLITLVINQLAAKRLSEGRLSLVADESEKLIHLWTNYLSRFNATEG